MGRELGGGFRPPSDPIGWSPPPPPNPRFWIDVERSSATRSQRSASTEQRDYRAVCVEGLSESGDECSRRPAVPSAPRQHISSRAGAGRLGLAGGA